MVDPKLVKNSLAGRKHNGIAGALRTSDGVRVMVTKHAATRYRERVCPDAPGWPEAMRMLAREARATGVVTDAAPRWLPVTEPARSDAILCRWLVIGDWIALPLRGRKLPTATTVMAR